ncbi:MAG: ParB/RepB/Spo0J family partition protein [Candidatus Hydrogenedentes bacterium]|nr:ParB/RepB/Spo0J family partition protein [Candidatus Hydrogenedentota bacterium]
MTTTIQITMVPVKQIIPSPDNPRIFAGPDGENPSLVELATSIKALGVLEPLLGRPHPEQSGKIDLRAGERRYRAAVLAGLKEVPVIVREMSDEEAWTITVTENLQREDLHPLEEAQGIEKLHAHGWTLEQIGDRLGRSAKWCARRRQLVKLTPEWQMEAMQGEATHWTAEHFEIIARFPETVQDELRGQAKKKYSQWFDMSASDLRSATADYLQALDLAPWPLDDETLCPAIGACANCPKRSDTEPLLFDVEDFDTQGDGKPVKPGARCLDAACWEVKHRKFLERRLEEVQAKTGVQPLLVKSHYDGMPEQLAEQATGKYAVSGCKKSEPGAVPCVTANGTMYWGKKLWGTDGGKKEKSLKDKRKALQKRRDLALIEKLLDKIPNEETHKDIPELSGGWLCALAAVFGSPTPTLHDDDRYPKDSAWEELERVSKSSSSDEVALRLGFMALGVIKRRLRECVREAAYRDDVRMTDVTGVCDLFEWPLDELRAEVAAEMPEPKGWGKLESGGKHGKDGKDKKDAKDAKDAKAKASKGTKGAKGAKGSKDAAGAKPGMCRVCGCTEGNACLDEYGDACAWADKTRTLCTHCADGRTGLEGTPWEGDPRVNVNGTFCDGYERVEVPMPRGSGAKVEILVIEASPGDWRVGKSVEYGNTGVGDGAFGDLPSLTGESFPKRDEAVLACCDAIIRHIEQGQYSKRKVVVKALEAWRTSRMMAKGAA